MVNFIDGTIRILYLKKDSVFYPIGCLTSNSFSEDVETIDTTTRENDGWKTARPTNQSFNISFEGLLLTDNIVDGKITYQDIKDFKRGRTLIDWKIEDTSGGNFETGNGYLTSIGESSSIDEFISFNGSIIGYGEPINQLNSILSDYVTRVEADSGTVANQECLRKYINSLL